ncbi:MAG: 30S ribosomal protein S6 [Candidatus Babeliales bacterium]
MFRYETLMLIHPQLTTDELSMIERHFDTILSEVEGKMVSFDKWGKYRLSYPVQRNDYGIYILVRYDVPEKMATKVTKEVDSFFKIKVHDIVMRFVTKKIDPSSPITYPRPDPVDSTRSGGVDSFIKEHKMEGFLSDVKEEIEENFQNSDEI